MPRRLFVFDEPDRFVAGAVGEPGRRAFYLQARQRGAVVTIGLEKPQVAALAQRIGELLTAVGQPLTAVGQRLSREAASPTPGDAVEPMVEVFRVGVLALGWDPDSSSLMVEARPINEDGEYPEVEDDDPEGPDLLRVRLSATEAGQFATAAAGLVQAGRPACPFCGQPLDPGGHFCVRMNGNPN
jgi:uncharacterized repeat protein (TIGR03847 family)